MENVSSFYKICNAASKNPEESKIFLEWLTSAEFAEIFANEVPGFFPLHTHSINVNDPVAKEFISWKDDCDTTIRNSVHIVGRGEPNLESVLWEVVSGVVNGTMSPEDANTRGHHKSFQTGTIVNTATVANGGLINGRII